MNSEIKIDNWDDFLTTNKEILKRLKFISTDSSSLLINIKQIYELSDNACNILSNLDAEDAKRIKELLIESSLEPSFNPPTNIDKKCVDYVDMLGFMSLKISFALPLGEQIISEYNNGTLDNNLINNYKDFINMKYEKNFFEELVSKGLWSQLEKQSIKGVNKIIDGILFDNVSEEIVEQVKRGTDLLTEKNIIYIREPIQTLLGALITGGFTFIKNVVDDEGNFTTKDYERTYLQVSASIINKLSTTVMSAYASECVSTALGGSIGGILGCGIGAAVGYEFGKYFSLMSNAFIDRITGDNIWITFEYEGRTYEIPRNGNGKNGEYDVMFNRVKDIMTTKYSIAGVNYSETNYYNILYSDYKFILNEDNNVYLSPGEYEIIDGILNDIKNSPNMDEAWNVICDIEFSGDTHKIELLNTLERYEFNYEDYYYLNHSNDTDKWQSDYDSNPVFYGDGSGSGNSHNKPLYVE